MGKSTHLTSAAVTKQFRIGGVGAHGLGGQSVTPDTVPSSWYPVNLPAASAATPANSDCASLLSNLSGLVALFTIQQSVLLASCYRTVSAGVAAGGTFTVNAVTSGATTSWFDQNISVKEAVAVDVVNKAPALTVDLALRLAVKAAAQIDKQLAALYASFTIAAVGVASTTPTQANLTTQINLVPNTGEPILGFFAPATLAAYLTANPSQTANNGTAPLIVPTSANKAIRLLASDAIVLATSNKNIVTTPSGLAFASASLGSSLGSAPAINPTGTVLTRASTWVDVEFATSQLVLQLVIGNTGSGAQTVYVNCLGAALCINPANGGLVLS